MIPELDVPKGPLSFEDANGLITYLEKRLQSNNGFISRLHFAQLAYLAGLDIPLTKEDLQQNWQFVSLHQHDYREVVGIVRKRITEGKVPDNWFDEFTRIMDNQTETQPTAKES